MAKRPLPPALKARAAAVKAAYATLAKTVPGFKQMHPHDRVRMTQRHIGRGKRGY